MNIFENFRLMIRNLLKTTLFKRTHASDVTRWEPEAALAEDWESRTQQIAGLISPKTSVLEFGAGRMVLSGFLPEGCSYTPSDIVDRGRNTIVCDLNASTLPVFPPHQVVVFSGVLEYVWDVPRLIQHLSPGVDCFILSYAITEKHRCKLFRRTSGWVNDYDSAAMLDLFKQYGYMCDTTQMWESQKIFRFVRE